MDIGKKLKELRLQNDLTLEDLASRSELTKGFLSQLERDLTSPSIATLCDILEALGTTLSEFFKEENQRLEKENKNLENLVAINKGAMREYREAFENAHDEAVADFSHFLIDKAKDGSIDICDLPDLVAEWKDKLPQSAELTAPSGREPDEAWLMERFMKVE